MTVPTCSPSAPVISSGRGSAIGRPRHGARTGRDPADDRPVAKINDRDPIILERGIGYVVGNDCGIGLREALFCGIFDTVIRPDRLCHDGHDLVAYRPIRSIVQRDAGERVDRAF